MALGRKSENQIPQIGGTPRPPVPPPPAPPAAAAPPMPPDPGAPPPPVTPIPAPAPAGPDVVTALDARLQELQEMVSQLVDKAIEDRRVPVAPPEGIDEDVLAASRTLQLAKRTADASLAEAQEEAARLLAEARAERDAILTAAHQAADRELSSQRTALADDTRRWESRRAELQATIRDLDVQLEAQRQQVEYAQALIHHTLEGGLDVPIESPQQPVAPEPEPVVVIPEPQAAEEATIVTDPGQPADATAVFGDAPPPPPFADAQAAAAADAAAPPTFLPVDEGVAFGTPPEPAPTPFYPWTEEQQPAAENAEEAGDVTFDPPAPVQRRGLFGH